MQRDHAMDRKAVDVLRGLIMDGTRKANSGHPGGAMSSADMVYILYKYFLRFNPEDTAWFNRDRFVLSAGHESMLQYALLHFCGHLDTLDLKNFRQWGSRTPGHPECGITPGVEAVTGPLGQGFCMAVGMAVAEAVLAAHLGHDICSHYTYVLTSDGDMQEPVVLGAASLAGHWGLGRLVVFYDANKQQLAGPVATCDSVDYAQVFTAFGWQVLTIDGHDHDAIYEAIAKGKVQEEKPTLIIGNTVMAKGTATKEDDFTTHGAPLSEEEIRASKEKLGLSPDEDFQVPEDVIAHFCSHFGRLLAEAGKWRRNLALALDEDESFGKLWQAVTGRRKDNVSLRLPEFFSGESVATRKAWGQGLNSLIDQLPFLVGGSADLDPSNQTTVFRDTVGIFAKNNEKGRNLCFGVREFPMGSILNGMALHGGIIPFGATFLVFSDYQRSAIRMSALQKLPVLHVFTHDSFYVGEDGPTHQPVEHISSLRLIPNLLVLRPADAYETNACLKIALTQEQRPSCLCLTRQGLPVLEKGKAENGPEKGGYILSDCEGTPEIVLLASGSEVSLALKAKEQLTPHKVRVVSVPCMELFDEQSLQYREDILPQEAFKVAVEAGQPDLWHKYTGSDGLVYGINHFGASAPAKILEEEYGFTPEQLVAVILSHSH